MVGGSGEAAMSLPSSGGGGKRRRDPEEGVYVDNLHSHKRYLIEVGVALLTIPQWQVVACGSSPLRREGRKNVLLDDEFMGFGRTDRLPYDEIWKLASRLSIMICKLNELEPYRYR